MSSKLITTVDAAQKTGLSLRYIQKLCADGRIAGAQQFGRTWLVPAGFKWKPLARGPKPKDGKRNT
jgi:excisionase family DNA binding protein